MISRTKPKRGASVTGDANFSDRIGSYLRSHRQSFGASLKRIAATPFSTVTAILVVAIALALPTVFYVLVDNAALVSRRVVDTNQMTLFLHPQLSDVKAATLAGRLLKRRQIVSVKLITKNQALEEFNQYSGFAGAIEILESNPLPATIQLNPHSELTPHQLKQLTQDIESIKEVDFVQFDLQWVRRLRAIMDVAQRGVEMLSALLGLGVIFVVSNTIRLELRTRHDEIVVAKLLGATNAFIRRPFLYSGFWYGFLGGVVASLLVYLSLLYFDEPIQFLSRLYDTDYELIYLGPTRLLSLWAGASVLGIFGAWMVLLHQLNQMNPSD